MLAFQATTQNKSILRANSKDQAERGKIPDKKRLYEQHCILSLQEILDSKQRIHLLGNAKRQPLKIFSWFFPRFFLARASQCPYNNECLGAVAQLGERYNGIVEVRSSNLLGSTNQINNLDKIYSLKNFSISTEFTRSSAKKVSIAFTLATR